MSIGGTNPLPMTIGGDLSPMEQSYNALKSLVGVNGSGPEGSLEAEWRWSRAFALGMLSTCDERATLQAFPQVAGDWTWLNESMLGVSADERATLYSRTPAVVAAYTALPVYSEATLLAMLQGICPDATVIHRDWTDDTTTMAGREYAPSNATPDFAYGGRDCTLWPNYSDEFEVTILVDLGAGGEPSEALKRQVVSMQDVLNANLPAWVDFQFIYEDGCFTLDLSLLDAACPGIPDDV